jgi:hypothetical protein
MKSTTIVPIAIALLQPQIAVSDNVQQHPQIEQQQNESERDLYSTETISMEVADPCATVPAIVEAIYTGDDEFAGTNKTLAPTASDRRPTPLPTLDPTVPNDTLSPTESLFVGTPTPPPIVDITIELDPTAHPTPYPNDDGGLTDDTYITYKTPTRHPTGKPSSGIGYADDIDDWTGGYPIVVDDDGKYITSEKPTKKPTRHPTGKPSSGIGYLPTRTNHPTTDDWISGWMPTNPAVDDTDDWEGGFPIVVDDDDKYNYNAGANLETKAGKSSGKSGKGSKSSKSGSSATDNGWGGGYSKVSSLVSSQMVSGAESVGGRWNGAFTVAAVALGMLVYLHV